MRGIFIVGAVVGLAGAAALTGEERDHVDARLRELMFPAAEKLSFPVT